jgi:DNA transformation protein
MEQLSKMPNIGKVLAEKLAEVGIDTPEKLKATGSENAFIRLKTVDSGACLSMLCALEGAIQDIRWHDLDKVRKEELKMFLKTFKK